MGQGGGLDGWPTLLVCWVQGTCSAPCVCSPHPDFAPGSSKLPLGILVSASLLQNLPQMCMHTAPYSPLQFLCILLLEERCVQVQAWQHCSTGFWVPACVTWRSLPAAPSLPPPTASSQGILSLHLLLPCLLSWIMST